MLCNWYFPVNVYFNFLFLIRLIIWNIIRKNHLSTRDILILFCIVIFTIGEAWWYKWIFYIKVLIDWFSYKYFMHDFSSFWALSKLNSQIGDNQLIIYFNPTNWPRLFYTIKRFTKYKVFHKSRFRNQYKSILK